MKYWIFIVCDHKDGKDILTSERIFKQRMEDMFWGIGRKTPNRKQLSKGDIVIFYLGNPLMEFAGTAELSSPTFKLSRKQREEYGHNIDYFTMDSGVELTEIDIWETRKKVKALTPELDFIENEEYWFAYFQGGVRQIPEKDYRTIVFGRESTLTERLKTTKDIESESEFALEAHLEEFIYNNWPNIGWGSKLELYRTEEQDGRQFPAGLWSIDFLAKDEKTNDLVVIELKKGKTSDAIIGQINRYINWVKENVAEPEQDVRGIIVAKEVDEALKYGIKGLDWIDVKTYQVDFRLHPFDK
ncbi:MAG: DUF1016 family protein [bacterium]|nr:DUF1016 family protein [bacterium]